MATAMWERETLLPRSAFLSPETRGFTRNCLRCSKSQERNYHLHAGVFKFAPVALQYFAVHVFAVRLVYRCEVFFQRN